MQPTLVERRRFLRPDGAVLVLDAAAIAVLLRFQQVRRCDAEAGGVLLGRHILDAPHVVVDEVTTPMKGDQRWFTGFHRGREAHQRVIDARWAASGGTCQYLGEWHTHPEALPNASLVDRRDWVRRLRDDRFDADSLFFLIVGTKGIRVWEGSRATATLTLLTELQKEPL